MKWRQPSHWALSGFQYHEDPSHSTYGFLQYHTMTLEWAVEPMGASGFQYHWEPHIPLMDFYNFML